MKVKIKGPFPEGMKISRAGKTFVAESDGDAYFTGKKKECEHLCAAYCYEVEVDEKVKTDAVGSGDENLMVGNGSENKTGEADAKLGADENESTSAVRKNESEIADETGAGEAEVNAEGAKAGTDTDVDETASKPSETIVEPAKKPRRRAAKKAE